MSIFVLSSLPSEITPRIRELIASLVPGRGDAVFVDIRPFEFCTPKNCHPNVAETVRKYGGIGQSGWSITHVPGEYYEFEAHAVWEHNDVTLDITPSDSSLEQRLFVRDGSVIYDGLTPVPSVYFSDGLPDDHCDRMNALAIALSDARRSGDEPSEEKAGMELGMMASGAIRRAIGRGWI